MNSLTTITQWLTQPVGLHHDCPMWLLLIGLIAVAWVLAGVPWYVHESNKSAAAFAAATEE